jgi:uncharacterized membrane protein
VLVRASLLQAGDSWALAATLCACAAGGSVAGKHTPFGRALSGPVCAMLLAWGACVAGVTPGPGPHFSVPQLAVVQLATPLLLLDADLRKLLGRSSRLGGAFFVAASATLLGCLLAFTTLGPFLREACSSLGSSSDAWKLAAALCAKNIGGGLNYVAVASATGMSPAAFAGGLIIDNAAGMLYFPLVAWLGRADRGETAAGTPAPAQKSPTPPVEDVLAALAASCAIVALAASLSPANTLPLATLLTLVLATAFPAPLSRLAPASEQLGGALLYVFFATAGASAGAPSAASSYLPFFGFVGMLYAVHLTLTLTVCRALKFSRPEALVASNAAIGGPATAAALAEGMGWTSLRTPGMLAGNLGNAVATFVSLALGQLVLSRM